MNQQFRFTDIAFCKEHPERPISYLYYKKDCPYPSRLACVKCTKKYNTIEGFEDVLEVLNDSRLILNNILLPKGKFDKLEELLNFLDQDSEEFIRSFKEEMFKFIEVFVTDLKQKLSSEIAKVRLQLNDALGFEKFRQTFKDILKVDKYHESQEWKKFEGTVTDFVLQFEEIKNEKLDQAHFKLKQTAYCFRTQLLSDFKSNMSKSVEMLSKNLAKKGFTTLCDNLFQFELIQRIQRQLDEQPKVTLLFKGTEHGMNGEAFYQKCSNQGRTLMLCKSKSGDVFGGYTPCQWDQKKNNYLVDETNTTFLFSCTRKEIYPNIKGKHAIWTGPGYGPYFGDPTLYIATDFQSGSSSLNDGCFSMESYKIENPSTHLMGTTPQLVEMEVFRID